MHQHFSRIFLLVTCIGLFFIHGKSFAAAPTVSSPRSTPSLKRVYVQSADERHREILFMADPNLLKNIPTLFKNKPDEFIKGFWLTLSRSPSRYVRDLLQIAVWRHKYKNSGMITAQDFNNTQCIAGFGHPASTLGNGAKGYMRDPRAFSI